MEIEVDFTFSAAHRLPFYDGPCFRMHGHNYRLRVVVAGRPDPRTGMVLDFEDLKKVVGAQVLSVVDHQTLNDVLENPTAENVAIWIWRRLEGTLPSLREVRLWENPEYGVVYRGDQAS